MLKLLQVQSQQENVIIQSKEVEADLAVQEKIVEKKSKHSELLRSDSILEAESQVQGGGIKLETQFQNVQVNQFHHT